MQNYSAAIEALLFVVGDDGLSFENIEKQLDISHNETVTALKELNNKYQADDTGICLIQTAKRFKLATKKEYTDVVGKYAQSEIASKLSQAALEILAIIAYKQPITRLDIEDIRGVQSSGPLHKLLLYDLIKEAGRMAIPGQPIIYETTDYFLDYFGLRALSDLPKINNDIIENNEARNLFFESFQLSFDDLVE